METATGRMSVLPTNSEIRLLSGRPVCPECGGPLFVDDWSRVRPHVEHEQHEQHDPDDEDASDLAAA
jgi:competence CoiA-like predicted nuclease